MNRQLVLFFWQDCISPHQLPYISELFRDHRIESVFLIAPIIAGKERLEMGWEQDLENIKGLTLIISPDHDQITSLMKEYEKSSIHLFSGIRADQTVFLYFKQSLNFNLRRGIITETPNLYKKPLWLHRFRFLLRDYIYVNKIDYVFAMGELAESYYKFWSQKWKVFQFGYCVKIDKFQNKEINGVCRIVFVGSLSRRKNVRLLLHALKETEKENVFQLDIIGNGKDESFLKTYVADHKMSSYVNFLGKRDMKETHKLLNSYDALILPSIYDGWGAVINEAIQSGLYVICSDACGAKILIQGSDRGLVFKSNNTKSLAVTLNQLCHQIDKIRSERNERILWTEKISGRSMANYVVDCLTISKTILPPWKN